MASRTLRGRSRMAKGPLVLIVHLGCLILNNFQTRQVLSQSQIPSLSWYLTDFTRSRYASLLVHVRLRGGPVMALPHRIRLLGSRHL